VIRPSREAAQFAKLLDAVPRQNARSRRRTDAGHVEILRPRYRDPLARLLIVPRLPERERWVSYPLDLRASWIWRLADGTRSVRELIVDYREIFPDEEDQLPERICRLLATLQREGFVALERRKAGAAEA
jgi:hypothetical protein